MTLKAKIYRSKDFERKVEDIWNKHHFMTNLINSSKKMNKMKRPIILRDQKAESWSKHINRVEAYTRKSSNLRTSNPTFKSNIHPRERTSERITIRRLYHLIQKLIKLSSSFLMFFFLRSCVNKYSYFIPSFFYMSEACVCYMSYPRGYL